MASRPVALVVLGLAALALGTPVAGALELAALQSLPDQLEFQLQLPPDRRQLAIAEDLLGFDRWRRLDTARFELSLHQSDLTPRLSDRPDRQDAIEEILTQSVLRLFQKRVQRRLQLIERRDAVRERLRGLEPGELERVKNRAGVDLSPQLRVGSVSTLGAELELKKAGSRFWSGTSLRIAHDLSGSDMNLKVAFRDHRRSTYLSFHTDHRKRGETIEVGIRYSFR